MRRIFFLLTCILLFLFCKAQDREIDSIKAVLSTSGEDTNTINTLLLLSRYYVSNSPEETIQYAEDARKLSVKLNYKKGEAVALKNIGIAYYYQGKYVESIESWTKSLNVFESIGDKAGIANILSNLGGIYDRSDEAKALDYYLRALRIAEEIDEKFRIATLSQNIGVLYSKKSATRNKALESYRRALTIFEGFGEKESIGTVTVNMGEIYLETGMDDSALYYFKRSEQSLQNLANLPLALNSIGKVFTKREEYNSAFGYHNQAYEVAKNADNKLYMNLSLLGLADMYTRKGEYKSAIRHYKRAQNFANEIHSNEDLRHVYEGLANAYAKLSEYDDAYNYQMLLSNIKDTLYNVESDRKLARLQFDFDMQKKEGQISLLTKDKALQDLELNRQKFGKNALIAGLGLVAIIAFILFRDYRRKVKTNKILDQQNDEIEGLLLNIFPSEVAKELQQEGHATPRYYESVSVLFTDIVRFTKIADMLSPQEVIAELNDFFMALDNIIETFHLEKIKTMGDCYMCAGGIPTPDASHPINIIKAAFAINAHLQQWNVKRKDKGLPPWEIRIGIHSGPVVAGVVGRKKYAYDIWGSTVNVASRMESNGEPGQVNISEATYELIKEQYDCIYRGKIYAKNVGEVDMYFVKQEKFAEVKPAEIGHTV